MDVEVCTIRWVVVLCTETGNTAEVPGLFCFVWVRGRGIMGSVAFETSQLEESDKQVMCQIWSSEERKEWKII